jgi:hypothetical protein
MRSGDAALTAVIIPGLDLLPSLFNDSQEADDSVLIAHTAYNCSCGIMEEKAARGVLW